MSLVPLRSTPFTADELIAALGAAYAAELGHAPDPKILAVLCAQLALETANGASCQNNNPGNYKQGASADWYNCTTFEYVGDPPVKTTMVCAFSAWPDLASGLAHVVRGLYTHYPEAWAAAVQGDPEGFAAGLRQRGYYTAPLELYAAGVRRWFTYYLSRIGGDAQVTEPELPSPGDASVLAVAGLDVRSEYQPPDA